MRLHPLPLVLLPWTALGKSETGTKKKDVILDSFDPAAHEWISVNDREYSELCVSFL